MKNKIGVYICHCGSNISDYVDVEKVKEIIIADKEALLVKTTMFACADSTQNEIVEDIKSNNLEAIVIASCSPKLHLQTFRNVAIRGGLNPYKYIQVNIREQCSWAHSDNPKYATIKAIDLIRASISKIKYSEELIPLKIPSRNIAVIIGAGVSGMRAAIKLANMGTYVYLIEKEHFVGGRITQWNKLYITGETGQEVITRLYKEIKSNDKIKLFTGAEVISKTGSVGNFEIKVKINPRYIQTNYKCNPENLKKAIDACPITVDDEFNFNLTKRKAIYTNYPGEYPEIPAIDADNCNKCGECAKICSGINLEQQAETITIKTGAILLTTGFDPYEPKKDEFGYNTIDNVITLQQFKRLIEIHGQGEKLIFNNKEIKNIAYIYCVGSRQPDGENKYCSRYCCTSTLHTAILVKNQFKNINNFHFNRGIRTYGKQEVLYDEASKNGDIFLQSYEDALPVVEVKNGNTTVKVNDILTANKEIEVDADLVVLVTGMVPRKNNNVVNILKVPVGMDKFLNEIHPKLRPVETVIDGVLIAGACQGPKNITESVKSSLSAAAKVNSLISMGNIEIEPTLAKIDENICEWCDKCKQVCPFDAIEKIQSNNKTIAHVIEANCKGCGMCLPVCDVNAIQLKGFTDIEMESMIEGMLIKV